MPDKNDRVRASFARAHNDLFSGTRYEATFYDYTTGSYDPDTGGKTGETRQELGTENVEIVPPGQDTTIENDGTSFSWTTSIRFPESQSIVGQLTPLGEDSERPTEVELTDQQSGETEVFELHSYTTEIGSGLIMCRLAEQ